MRCTALPEGGGLSPPSAPGTAPARPPPRVLQSPPAGERSPPHPPPPRPRGPRGPEATPTQPTARQPADSGGGTNTTAMRVSQAMSSMLSYSSRSYNTFGSLVTQPATHSPTDGDIAATPATVAGTSRCSIHSTRRPLWATPRRSRMRVRTVWSQRPPWPIRRSVRPLWCPCREGRGTDEPPPPQAAQSRPTPGTRAPTQPPAPRPQTPRPPPGTARSCHTPRGTAQRLDRVPLPERDEQRASRPNPRPEPPPPPPPGPPPDKGLSRPHGPTAKVLCVGKCKLRWPNQMCIPSAPSFRLPNGATI